MSETDVLEAEVVATVMEMSKADQQRRLQRKPRRVSQPRRQKQDKQPEWVNRLHPSSSSSSPPPPPPPPPPPQRQAVRRRSPPAVDGDLEAALLASLHDLPEQQRTAAVEEAHRSLQRERRRRRRLHRAEVGQGQEIDLDNMSYEELLELQERIGHVPVTLSPELLGDLAVVTVGEGQEVKTCAVCLEGVEPGQKTRLMPCQDTFHQECIDEWLLNNRARCPCCQLDLKELLA